MNLQLLIDLCSDSGESRGGLKEWSEEMYLLVLVCGNKTVVYVYCPQNFTSAYANWFVEQDVSICYT